MINLHHLAPVMQEWIDKSAFAGRICPAYEDPILGTGGTLLRNRDFVANDAVMLIHADNLCLADFSAYCAAHENRPPGTEITMMTFNTSSPETCGIVALDGKGVVQDFYEKVTHPPGNLANAAVYIIEPGIMDFLAGLKKSFIDFSTEVLPYHMGRINTFHNAVYHRDIGTIDSFLTAQWECPQGILRLVDGNDAWRKLCEKNDGKLPKKILSSLSEFLHLEVIDLVDNDNDDTLRTRFEGDHRQKAVFVMDSERNLMAFAQFLDDVRLPKDDQLVFIRKASADFSSKKILKEQGLKTIAFCACDAP